MTLRNEDLQVKILEKALLSEAELKKFLDEGQAKHLSLEQILQEKHVFSDDVLNQMIAEVYGVPYVNLSDLVIKESLLPIVPYALASAQYVIPFEQGPSTLKLALANPHNYELINFLEKKTGLVIEPHYSSQKEIQLALKAYNRDVNKKFEKLLEGAMSNPNNLESLKDASKIVDTIILFAYQSDASDIHLEPHKNYLVVRYRIDGILGTIAELPIAIAELVVTRIKVLANLRTDEHRAAQDGRFRVNLENNEITLRVSILPTYDGEKVVLRLLSSDRQELDLETLGYSERNLKAIKDGIQASDGLILMTGPTGSGKTTTLYSIMSLLNSPEVNISTIEDPIEYRLPGINQTQVNPKTDLTFANGLRSLVRQDPDIIMVGEIRDEETGSVAINAALTGHLVLATLHTNDAASTLPRMLEMDIESFLLAATARVVIAQRLVRKICDKCKVQYSISIGQLTDLGKKFSLKEDLEMIFNQLQKTGGDLMFSKGEGCSVCGGSGYKGRTCIAEVMEVSETIQKLIVSNTQPKQIEEQAVKEGMVTMFMDGMQKVLEGSTTIEEVLRVMRS